MASKSKRRRRVLGASCILAALIIAASSFAWFTSKDEVTNRLSANADYGVSIVESFAPPANWLPGNTVNKDVYATNTGNIGAFVKEEVSGVLSLTMEKTVDTWDDKCVELKPEEVYVKEAGAFLAFKPVADTTNKVGDQIVYRPDDQTTPASTDFKPYADGLYVFRRTITVDSTSRGETFEYDGYYFKSGKYYKITNLEVTPDATVDLADDGVRTDGNLSDASSKYLKLEKQVASPVGMTYDASTNTLVATYDTGILDNKDATLTAAAAAYDAAIEDYERAAEAVTRATNDIGDGSSGTSEALATARADLEAAQTRLTNATNDLAAKNTALTNATNRESAADAAVTATQTAYNDANNLSALETALSNATADKGNVKANARTQFETDFGTWIASQTFPSGHKTLATLTYEEFITFPSTDQNYEYYEKVAAEKLAKRDRDNKAMELYGKTDGSESDYTPGSLYGKYQAALAEQTAAAEALNTATTEQNAAQTEYDAAESNYTAKLGLYNTALSNSGTADTNLRTAQAQLAAATAKKAAAKKAYEDALKAADDTSSSVLKINIKLADVVTTADGTNNKWQLLPTTLVGNKAEFYYTGILPSGTTSSKLIDSVELDPSVTQDMYQSFDFDLNVALKSAQVAYADDQTTINTQAAIDELGKTPTLANATSEATAINWA